MLDGFSLFQVVITNMEASVINLDAKKWPDAPEDDVSSFYKVYMEFCVNCFAVL